MFNVKTATYVTQNRIQIDVEDRQITLNETKIDTWKGRMNSETNYSEKNLKKMCQIFCQKIKLNKMFHINCTQ